MSVCVCVCGLIAHVIVRVRSPVFVSVCQFVFFDDACVPDHHCVRNCFVCLIVKRVFEFLLCLFSVCVCVFVFVCGLCLYT